jgi:hypothetical protein
MSTVEASVAGRATTPSGAAEDLVWNLQQAHCAVAHLYQ